MLVVILGKVFFNRFQLGTLWTNVVFVRDFQFLGKFLKRVFNPTFKHIDTYKLYIFQMTRKTFTSITVICYFECSLQIAMVIGYNHSNNHMVIGYNHSNL
jgi:ABC-type phosphate/phosphonate transport system permease subunit